MDIGTKIIMWPRTFMVRSCTVFPLGRQSRQITMRPVALPFSLCAIYSDGIVGSMDSIALAYAIRRGAISNRTEGSNLIPASAASCA
jgi:hypothetical protein